MAELKLIVFDCDGVMFDSREANKQYYNRLLEHFGHTPMSGEEIEYVHTHNVMDSVQYIFRQHPATDIEEVHRFREQLGYTEFLPYMLIEPDLKEFLGFLKPRYLTAISTNRTTTMPTILRLFELEAYFDMVVTAFDVSRPKPHPEALTRILSHFGLAADEAVFIGDSMVDRQHAAGVGMRLIAFKNPALDAEYHASSFMEIADLPLFRH